MKLLIIGIVVVWFLILIPLIKCLISVFEDFQNKKDNDSY